MQRGLFFFQPRVINHLYWSQQTDPSWKHPGLSFWTFAVPDFPSTNQHGLRPPYLTRLPKRAGSVSHMVVVPCNLPMMELTEEQRRARARARSRRGQPLLTDPLDLVREEKCGQQADGVIPEEVPYRTDIDNYSVWRGENVSSESDSESEAEEEADSTATNALQHSSSSSSSSQVRAGKRGSNRKKGAKAKRRVSKERQPRSKDVASPFNTHLISKSPENLTVLLPHHSFPGFISPFL